jgi:hypothetical protein
MGRNPPHRMKTITFHNWSDQDFTWTFGNEPTTFKAGQRVILPDYLANHFAKHFVDRELIQTVDEKGNELPVSHHTRKALLEKTLLDESVEPSSLAAQIRVLNVQSESPKKHFCDTCDSKGVRHKNTCPKVKKDEVFEGLEA